MAEEPTPLPKPPLHPQEMDRLASLYRLGIADSEADPLFNEIARQAAALCRTPFATVTLVREHEQFFLGNQGMPAGAGDRDEAICAHAILQAEPLVVEDARRDPRFARFGGVVGPPFLRFYAGVPFYDRFGLPLGTVCALDDTPREIGVGALLALRRLATVAGVALETRRLVMDLLGTDAGTLAVGAARSRLDDALRPLLERTDGSRATLA